MRLLAALSVLVVSGLHFGFLALEMFLWQQPQGLEIFDMTAEQAAETAILAANQGLYNGFLAVGLLWGLFVGKRDVVFLFLLFVIVAGLYGAATASESILFVQAAPGVLALVLTILAGRSAASAAD